jgi:hypothetical protein
MPDKKQIAFWLDRADADLLRELAWMNRLSMADFLRRCIREEGKKLDAEDKRAEMVP